MVSKKFLLREYIKTNAAHKQIDFPFPLVAHHIQLTVIVLDAFYHFVSNFLVPNIGWSSSCAADYHWFDRLAWIWCRILNGRLKFLASADFMFCNLFGFPLIKIDQASQIEFLDEKEKLINIFLMTIEQFLQSLHILSAYWYPSDDFQSSSLIPWQPQRNSKFHLFT